MIQRPAYLNQLLRHKDRDLIKVVTGMRRCGKSVLLFELFVQKLLETGVPPERLIRVNLEDLENVPLRQAQNLYSHIIAQTSGREGRHYIFIDEIQYVDGFEDVLNNLKNKGHDVYVTGSNSRLLSSDIATSLRGRSVNISVFPLSFQEYFSFAGGDRVKAYNDYFLYGGLPFLTRYGERDDKIKYLSDIEQTVAFRDVIERNSIRNPTVFYAVYHFLCSNIGSLVSIKKIADSLKSAGQPTATVDTIASYVDALCGAFLFRKLYRYDIKGKEHLKTLNKYYITDMGLRNVQLNFRQCEVSRALENIVCMDLLRRGYLLDIGKNRTKEIDFIARRGDVTHYIQVAWSIVDEEKRKTELLSFKNVEPGFKKIVITMDTDPFTVLENGYKKINALDFLLDDDSLEKI